MQYLRRLAGLALMVIAIPLMIPGLLVVGIVFFLPLGIVLCLWNLIGELRFTLKMMWNRRFVPWYMLGNLQLGDRLILESPTIGWRISRLWLAPSHLFNNCPFEPPQSEDECNEFENGIDPYPVHPFHEWLYQRCLSPESGAGILIRAWNGQRFEKYVARRNPGLVLLQLWSAPVCMKLERVRAEAQNGNNNPMDVRSGNGLKTSG